MMVSDSKDSNPKDVIGDTKVNLSNLSPIASAYWSVAQTAGALKYGSWNWRASGVRVSTYVSAIKRHLDKYNSGEEYDNVDGTHHLGNIMAGCAILLEARALGNLNDDRPPSFNIESTYKECQDTIKNLKVKYKSVEPFHYNVKNYIIRQNKTS
jgi:hypothetical protein